MNGMRPQSRNILIAITCLALGLLIFFFTKDKAEAPVEVPAVEEQPVTPIASDPRVATIGTSYEGRAIESYTFGKGEKKLIFVGGIHGGYEWNSTLLAYAFIDHLTEYPETIPANITITIVPGANPDGLFKVVGKEGRFALLDIPADSGPLGTGRFNARDVDLNRNFDCKWKSESTWRGNIVSAGTEAFSEPEAATIRDLVLAQTPEAVVFWHSQANAVYASECENGILPNTLVLMNAYANAAGYPAVDSFDAYPVSGDAEGWLASIGIPAITVELKTHETIEWEKNLAGFKAVLSRYTEAVE